MKKVDIFKIALATGKNDCACEIDITVSRSQFLFCEVLTEEEQKIIAEKFGFVPKKMACRKKHTWDETFDCGFPLQKVLDLVETFGEVESPEELLVKAMEYK